MEDNNKTETKTVGQMIGVVDHAFSITNSAGETVTLSVKIDFSTSTLQDIKSWLVSNRIIAGQRPWRNLSKKELNELNNQTFSAVTIGTKVKSREQQKVDMINLFVASGVDVETATTLATAAINNPASLKVINDEE